MKRIFIVRYAKSSLYRLCEVVWLWIIVLLRLAGRFRSSALPDILLALPLARPTWSWTPTSLSTCSCSFVGRTVSLWNWPPPLRGPSTEFFLPSGNGCRLMVGRSSTPTRKSELHNGGSSISDSESSLRVTWDSVRTVTFPFSDWTRADASWRKKQEMGVHRCVVQNHRA